jgi:hypothetical protein
MNAAKFPAHPTPPHQRLVTPLLVDAACTSSPPAHGRPLDSQDRLATPARSRPSRHSIGCLVWFRLHGPTRLPDSAIANQRHLAPPHCTITSSTAAGTPSMQGHQSCVRFRCRPAALQPHRATNGTQQHSPWWSRNTCPDCQTSLFCKSVHSVEPVHRAPQLSTPSRAQYTTPLQQQTMHAGMNARLYVAAVHAVLQYMQAGSCFVKYRVAAAKLQTMCTSSCGLECVHLSLHAG